MALTFEVQWILNNRYWRLICECVNNVHIIRGIGHGANLNVGYPTRAAVLGLAAAAAWQQKYLMLAPGLHLGSGSSLEPRPQLTSASPSLNTLPAAWSPPPPPPPQLTSLPHQHSIISDITPTMESSHSAPLYSHTREVLRECN